MISADKLHVIFTDADAVSALSPGPSNLLSGAPFPLMPPFTFRLPPSLKTTTTQDSDGEVGFEEFVGVLESMPKIATSSSTHEEEHVIYNANRMEQPKQRSSMSHILGKFLPKLPSSMSFGGGSFDLGRSFDQKAFNKKFRGGGSTEEKDGETRAEDWTVAAKIRAEERRSLKEIEAIESAAEAAGGEAEVQAVKARRRKLLLASCRAKVAKKGVLGKAHAALLRDSAAECEPALTALLVGLAADFGGELAGLNFRFKSHESLEEKIGRDVHKVSYPLQYLHSQVSPSWKSRSRYHAR